MSCPGNAPLNKAHSHKVTLMALKLSHPDNIILGTGFRVGAQNTERELITLPMRDLHHLHCCGVSGYGKSSFIASFIVMLLSQNIPVFVIDPHGDLAKLVLKLLIHLGYFTHPAAFDQLIYLDLATAARQ